MTHAHLDFFTEVSNIFTDFLTAEHSAITSVIYGCDERTAKTKFLRTVKITKCSSKNLPIDCKCLMCTSVIIAILSVKNRRSFVIFLQSVRYILQERSAIFTKQISKCYRLIGKNYKLICCFAYPVISCIFKPQTA